MDKIPEPKFISGYQYPFLGNRFSCGCGCEETKEKTDCYFYHDEIHMGGHIPTCNYHGKLGYCPCEGCGKYIAESEVAKGVREYVDRERERREMRVSLFRGKRIDNGEWAEGNLLRLDSGIKGSPYEYDCYIVPMITNGSWRKYDFCLKFISPCFAVDPSTVCQYTKLTDKNGKKIWEGDIVNCHKKRGAAFWQCKVVWNEVKARFDVIAMDCAFPMCNDAVCSDISINGLDYEVIGNVFDNPELVKNDA